jgi:hypothetical protein
LLPLAWQQRWSRLPYVRDFAELVDQIEAHAVVVGEEAIERAVTDAILGGVQIAVPRINANALTPFALGRLLWAGCSGPVVLSQLCFTTSAIALPRRVADIITSDFALESCEACCAGQIQRDNNQAKPRLKLSTGHGIGATIA